MSVAFPQSRALEHRLGVPTDAPIHWPSAIVGLVLAVVVVVGVSWLAQPRRSVPRTVQHAAQAGAQPAPVAEAPPEVAVAPTPIPQPAVQAPTADRARVSGTNGAGVNLRQRPGERGTRIRTLPEGATLELVGADEVADGAAWRNVRDANGSSGWVAARFLSNAAR